MQRDAAVASTVRPPRRNVRAPSAPAPRTELAKKDEDQMSANTHCPRGRDNPHGEAAVARIKGKQGAAPCELPSIADMLQAAVETNAPGRRPQNPNRKLVINTSDAGHARTLLCLVGAARSWRTDIVRERKADVYFVISEDDIGRRLAELKPGQRMSRMLGMRELCDKVPFARLMRRMQEVSPKEFAFFPFTYTLPGDLVPNSAWSHGPLIFKPDSGAGGDGIYLLSSPADLAARLRNKSSGGVAQQYIDKPMLLQGYKWDIRVYVLILSLSPLRVFMCQEGLARVCSEPYAAPTQRTMHKIGAHLTNYSISKYAPEYNHADDPTDGTQGTKRTLSSTLEFLRSQGADVDSLTAEIYEICKTTTAALASEFDGQDVVSRQCFHILGLDIMFDKRGKGWLLEVNTSPSLNTESVFAATGPYKQEPADPPADAPYAHLVRDAKVAMGSKATKLCTCSSHHRPHLHAPCAVDLVAKTACVEGTLEIVRRDMRCSSVGEKSCAELAKGTEFIVVHDAGSQRNSRPQLSGGCRVPM